MTQSQREAALNRLILALDVPTLEQAVSMYHRMNPYFGWFKVGLELFSAHGPQVFDRIHLNASSLMLRTSDIPNTVAGASAAAARLGVWIFNIHAAGGSLC